MSASFDSALIKTKYCIPRGNPGVVPRKRLLEKLGHAAEHALTLVVAPVGYGKTTAVREWAEQSGMETAWLSLDEGDDDLILFWRYIFAAMERILPGIGASAEYAFSSHPLLEANVHINILIDRLAERAGEAVLVIDDLHVLSGPQIFKGLSHLLQYLPANAHVVILGRTEPDMELGRLELQSGILRVTAKDLQFREEEAREFYLKRGCPFDKETIEKIGSYTEGWAAAMVALAASAENDCLREDLLSREAGGTDLYQYMMNEVFKAYSPEKRAFLLKISILEFLQEGVCGAVTDERDVKRFFEEIRKKNEFLAILGEEKNTYRLHPILKDFLLQKLTEEHPELPGVLHQKAATWYESQGLLSLAVSHYLSGRRYEEAFSLIEKQLGSLASKNDYETARSWLGQLPEAYRQGSVKIAVFYSMYEADKRDFEASRAWLVRARGLLEEGQGDARDRVLTGLARANLLIREENAEELCAFIQNSQIPEGNFQTIEYMDLNDSSISIYRSPVRLMVKLFELDPEAFRRLRDFHSLISTKKTGFLPLVAGEHFYEQSEPDRALPLLLEAAETGRQAAYPGTLVPAMAGIARIRRSRGDRAGALCLLDECEKILRPMQKPHWNDLVSALKARYFLEAGDMEAAEKWARTNKLQPFSELNRAREFELIVLARVLWAQKNPDDAEILLTRLLSFAEREGRLHSQAEILNLLSMIACQKGSAALSAEYLKKSLAIGLSEGYLRSYLDEQAALLPALRQLLRVLKKGEDSQALRDFTKLILSLIQEEARAPAGSRLKKLLTEKEFKVLELLCAACSNEEIAKKLGIGERTVKAHTGSIYAKLGVKTRAQCVRLAYEEGVLLPDQPE